MIPVKTLLDSGKFVVPDFQRNYAWESKQVNEFWNDLEFVSQNKNDHFVGSVILLLEEPSTDLQVIDGQQRLTTIFILISLIRDLMLKQETQLLQTPVQTFDVSHEPISVLFKDLASGEPRFQGNAQIREDLLDFVMRNPTDHKRREFKRRDRSETRRLRKAVFFLDKNLRDFLSRNAGEDVQSKLRVLNDLFQTILKNLKVMMILSHNRKEAVTIYMTLNNRGLGLSPSDLVKSLLIRFVSRNMAGEGFLDSKEVLQKWGEIVENIGEESLDQFLRHYQLVYGTRDDTTPALLSIREKDIFSIFERDIQGEARNPVTNPSEKAYKLLLDLIKKSETYGRFVKFDQPDQDEVQKKFDLTFRGLHSFSDSYRIALLALFDDELGLSLPQLDEWVHSVESLAIRWVIMGGNAQVLENIFQSTAVDSLRLRNEPDDASLSLRKRFSDNWQSDERIVNRLKETFEDSSLTRYIAFKINEKLSGDNGVIKFDPKLIHVEHIAPDAMTDHWRQALKIQQIEPDDITAEYEEFTERIGNKTVLEWRINTSIKNKEFDVKKNGFSTGRRKVLGYKDSSLQITTDLLGLDHWSKELIEKRSKWFAEMFNIVWGLPTNRRVISFVSWLAKAQ